MNAPARKAHYIMIGGFLGSGKTTAVAAVAHRLVAQGKRVGLITNDQGSELVDTAMLRARGFATEEIPGGCFCCRFNSLVEAAEKLDGASSPDVFIAEPVGSCTDLVATVSYPLSRIYGQQFTVAPLSVLVDPIRAERVLGISEGGKFSDKVLYIYRKQLEEAEFIVIAKADLLTPERLEHLRSRLAEAFPRASILDVSVRADRGVEAWLRKLTDSEQKHRATMDVDYGIYAEGEALLGWLNATIELRSTTPFDTEVTLRALAQGIQARLLPAEIAHLKMTLSPADGLGDIAAINLVRSDFVPELSLRLEEPITAGQIILNLRAEAAPDLLREAVTTAVDRLGADFEAISASLDHLECFRPGKPEPTHRDLLSL